MAQTSREMCDSSEFFSRMRGSRIFSGESRPDGQKTVWTTFFFFFFFFFSLQLILQFTEGFNGMVLLQRQGSRGGQHFPGGGGGVQMLISIATHILVILQGGGGGPDLLPPPL